MFRESWQTKAASRSLTCLGRTVTLSVLFGSSTRAGDASALQRADGRRDLIGLGDAPGNNLSPTVTSKF